MTLLNERAASTDASIPISHTVTSNPQPDQASDQFADDDMSSEFRPEADDDDLNSGISSSDIIFDANPHYFNRPDITDLFAHGLDNSGTIRAIITLTDPLARILFYYELEREHYENHHPGVAFADFHSLVNDAIEGEATVPTEGHL